jgi:hypothetical protein
MKIGFKTKKTNIIFLSATIVLLLIIMLFSFRKGNFPGYHTIFYTPKKYIKQIEKIQDYKTQKYREYRASQNPDVKQDILIEAGEDFSGFVINKLFPYWFGTRWSFEGMTETPGKGSIACGYLVSTILRDAGVKIKRSELAQMPSESMILSVVSNESVHRFSNTKVEEIYDYLMKQESKLFLVGLDTHTGFLYKKNNKLYFVHSSGKYPWAVVREDIFKSQVFLDSEYKVFGAMDTDLEFIEKWLAE